MEEIFCGGSSYSLEIREWRRIMPSLDTSAHVLNPSTTWFFGIYLNSQRQKSLKNQYLSHSESKSYQTNSIKILLGKIFPTTPKAHSNSSEIFSYDLIEFNSQ
jgi:hypothetical protein